MNLSGKLPEGDANGLGAIENQLIAEPGTKCVVLAVVDAAKTTTNLDTGETVATARIRRIEPLLEDDLPHARRLLQRAFEKRTGQVTLPFELEQELEEAFEGADEETEE